MAERTEKLEKEIIERKRAEDRMAKTEMQIWKCHFDDLIRDVIRDLQPEIEGRKILWKICRS